MSLDSILSHISQEAASQEEKIIQEAQKEAQGIIQEAKLQADRLQQEILDKETALYKKEKQGLIVNARLESKKNLLEAKQELLDAVFEKLKHRLPKDKFKKEQISGDKKHQVAQDIDFYLKAIRPDYESEIAKIVFS